VCVIAVLAAVCAQASADGKDLGWSYDTVAKRLDRPAWLDNVVIIDSYQNVPFANDEKTELVPWAKRLQDAGLTILTYVAADKVAGAHAAGVKVVYGMRPFIAEGWMAEAIKAHPEWLLHTKPGVPSSKEAACLLSPFGEYVVNLLAENVRKYGIDAYTFDGWYQTRYCCCDYCSKTYKQDTGFSVPRKINGDDPNYRRFLVWRDKKLMERALQLNKAIKTANPEAIVINWSNNDANGAYPSWMPESLNTVFDMNWKEWWNSYDVLSIWLNKRLRGSAGDVAPAMQPYMFARWMKDIESGVYHGSSTPMAEVRYQMHEAMTMGAVPILWSGARTGFTPKDWDTVIGDWIDYLPYVNGTRTLKYVACIDSYTTLQMSKISTEGDFHGPMEQAINDKVASHRGGVARTLLESHIPFDVIAEHNVTPETLSQYKVVVLPNNFCMSDRIAEVLRGYVAKGGGLVATYESSLYDQWGERRKDFALADVFGASYIASYVNAPNRVGFAQAAHQITDDPYLRDIMGTGGYNTFWGKFTRVKAAANTIAPLDAIDTPNANDASKKNWPPLLVSEYKFGKVAYFPAAFDAAYFDASYPYQRVVMANAVRWAAQGEPPVRVTAPMCVMAGFLTKETAGKKQTIVHLLNDLHTGSGHGSAADKQFALREEVIPLANIKVLFRGQKPERVKLAPAGTELGATGVDGGWEVTVPELTLHSVVVAEYGK